MSVATDLAAHLATRLTSMAVTGGPWSGTNVRPESFKPAAANAGKTNAIPHKCIFVRETAGLASTPYIDGDGKDLSTGTQGTKSGMLSHGFQVVVRGDKADETGAKTLADKVAEALRWYPPTGYVECDLLGSGASEPFEDGTQHWVATVNGILWRRVG